MKHILSEYKYVIIGSVIFTSTMILMGLKPVYNILGLTSGVFLKDTQIILLGGLATSILLFYQLTKKEAATIAKKYSALFVFLFFILSDIIFSTRIGYIMDSSESYKENLFLQEYSKATTESKKAIYLQLLSNGKIKYYHLNKDGSFRVIPLKDNFSEIMSELSSEELKMKKIQDSFLAVAIMMIFNFLMISSILMVVDKKH